MDPDAFAVLLGCASFVVGVGFGLFIGDTRKLAAQKGKPVSARRLRRLHVLNPLLEGPMEPLPDGEWHAFADALGIDRGDQ